MKTTQQSTFDAIVIGSGIGGLTVAALLAKHQRKRVLVLEQHFQVGGFTHEFERKGKFCWDVGLHYVGGMGKGNTARALFDYLTDGQLQWQKMPDVFEKFVYPDFCFEVKSDPNQFQRDLIRQFPHEKSGIQQYFRDAKKAAFWYTAHNMLELFPKPLLSLLKPAVRYFGAIARLTTQKYLDRHFQDHHLKALLTSQWGDYGLPPAQSCFGIHSLIVTHYFQGGWYPVGGASAIAQWMIPIIEEAGGEILTQRRVTKILLASGVAVGVKVENTAHSEEYHAPVIVSDAGAFNTYQKLIPASYPISARESIQHFPKSYSAVTLYLGLKESPEKLGFQGENHWIYSTYDHNQVNQSFPTFQSCYLSFPSLKNPAAKAHTAEVIAHVDYKFFSHWRNQPWRRRGSDYQQLKSQIAQSLIQFVENYYPEFQELIEYTELSTPLTIEHFDNSDRGAVYGIPCIPERLDQDWVAAKTPIKNLYLTGADVLTPGIVGAMMGGVKTAGLLQGSLGFFQIMATVRRKHLSH